MDRDLIERRILDAMTAACSSEMVWGRDDCVLWVADILQPVIGDDFIQKYRGRYRSWRGAQRVMGKGGLKANIERLAIERGWAWTPPDRAQVGDVGLAQTFNRAINRWVLSTVICRAPGWFVGRSEYGFAAVKSHQVLQAWAVK